MKSVKRPEEMPDYEAMKRLARDRDPAVRQVVAQRPDAAPELIYFLACDPSLEVRRAVANSATAPAQANLLLAQDPDQAVREALARKVAKLLPRAGEGAQKQAERHLIETLERLAVDQATRVRAILSEILNDQADAPQSVIKRLAQDVEALVADPVLQFSPLLSPADLIEIIDGGCASGRLTAISRRRGLGTQVSDAIVSTADERAITALLENHSAQIREQTINQLVEQAASVTAWHAPLVSRPRIPSNAAVKLATFVADHLLRKLQERQDLDPEALRKVSQALHRRLDQDSSAKGGSSGGADERLNQALASGDQALARSRLAALTGYPERVIERVLKSGSAKAITALAWKAGLAMPAALQVQLRLGGLSPQKALHPAAGGGFPMSDEEMGWQLEFFESLAKQG